MRKKLSWLIYPPAIILLILLQESFFPQFGRVKPDLVLLFVISTGLLKGYGEGAAVGAVGGILAGLISWNPCGIYLLAYGLAGFAAGLVHEKIEADTLFVPLISGLAGSAGFVLLFSVLGQALEVFYLSLADLYQIFIFLCLNAIFSIPVFILTRLAIIGSGRDIDIRKGALKSDYLLR